MGFLGIKNRLVRSATGEGLSTEQGAPTRRLIEVTTELAEGGVGLIIAGAAYISEEGRYDRRCTGMDSDALIEPLSRLTNAVHHAGGILAAQLFHSGSVASPAVLREKEVIYGPSFMSDPVNGRQIAQLSKNHILRIVEDFSQAALRTRKAGYDAVQIHGAHGYLINQFLSPYRNRRIDTYGGSPKKRARLLFQVYEAIRGIVGKDYPVFIKLSAHDGFSEGLMPEDAVWVAGQLDAMGIDAVEVSAGTQEGARKGGWDHIKPAPFEEGGYFQYALQIKENVRCPVITVEGWRDPLKIALALEKVDAVSMCRPFIREPNLANRWRSGDLASARCVSCNKCLDSILDAGLSCIFNNESVTK
jgi:2,4-dienoyl-CoA reductase-like NADH-dependent reductase (Old Yellow Enzyme family)